MEFVPSPFHKIITCCGRTKLKAEREDSALHKGEEAMGFCKRWMHVSVTRTSKMRLCFCMLLYLANTSVLIL